jgi:3-hydroxyisobutyrate dehydrogenase
MKVGFIGIGNMGRPMAANVLKAGHELMIHDSDPARCADFTRAHGGSAARAPADFAAVEFLVTMLPIGAVVREVLLGQEGVARHLAPGTVVIDMSSSEPNGTRDLGEQLARQRITLLDAPVSGGVPRARSGTLAIMIGADDAAAIERSRPLLASMGDRLFETGRLGSGHAMKALNNFVAAACYTAAAEALLAGGRFGLDPHRMLDIINVSTGRNFNTEIVMKEHVVDRRFATGFTLGLLAKDVAIAANLAREMNLDAPLTRLIRDRYAWAQARLGGDRDNSEALLSWDNPLAP